MEHSAIAAEAAAPARAAFSLDLAALSAAVDFLARRVIEKRQSVAILGAVHIAAEPDNRVTVTATDTDIWASVTVPANVESPGALCTDADALQKLLAKVRKGRDVGAMVDFCDKDGRPQIHSGRNRYSLAARKAEDFPLAPIVDECAALSRFSVPAMRFLADLAALAPCQSKEEVRYYPNGIAIEAREMAGRDRLVMVATDGHSMGIASREMPAGAEGFPETILPRKAVAAIAGAPYVTRAEIEAGPVTAEQSAQSEEAAPVEIPEFTAPVAAQSESEVLAAPEGLEQAEAQSEAPTASTLPVDIEVNNSDSVAAPLAGLVARIEALEARLGTLPAESGAPPIEAVRTRRTAAHERAIHAYLQFRRYRENAKAAFAEKARKVAALQGREAELLNDAWSKAAANRAAVAAEKAKRRRNAQLARQRGRDLVAMAAMLHRHADELEMARRSPRYVDQEGREGLDQVGRAAHHARTAIDKAEALQARLSEAEAARDRLQEHVGKLGDEMVAQNLRANRAEVALAAIKARADGWPPAARSVRVSYAA